VVKIRPPVLAPTPPTAPVTPEDETQVGAPAPQAPPAVARPDTGKVTFRLRKDADGTKTRREIALPGVGETPPEAVAAPESAATVAATPVTESPEAATTEAVAPAAEGPAAATVVLAPAEETVSAGKKKGLRLKTGKAKEEAAPAAAAVPAPAAGEPQAEAAPEEAPLLVAAPAGPGTLAAAAAVLAFVGVGALLFRLAWDFMRYL
jgi:hypothetical protein